MKVRAGVDDDPARRAAVVAAVASERVGWAFGETGPDDLADFMTNRRAANRFEKYAAHPDHTIRQAVAAQQDCPPWVLDALADDEDERVVRTVAVHQHTTAETLDRLARTNHRRWYEVAIHPHTSTETLRHLVDLYDAQTDEQRRNSDWFLGHIAKNPHCPPDLLHHWLRRDMTDPGDLKLRTYAVTNPNADADDLVALLGIDRSIDRAVTSNPRVPIDVAAIHYQRAPIEAQLHLLERPDCPADVFRRVVQTRSLKAFRRSLAKNPNCPSDVLSLVAGDSRSVRRMVANHPNTDRATLEMITRQAGDAAKTARRRLEKEGSR